MNEQSNAAAIAAGKAIETPADLAAPARTNDAGTNHGGGALGQVVVNVRFQPNGLVNTINQRPDGLGPQDWFDRLCRAVPLTYQPLSGGRGAFTIPSAEFDLILRDLVA
jgi:hypothetical protein